MFTVRLSVLLVISLVIFFGFDSIKERFYIFDPPVLHSIASDAIAKYPNDTGAIVGHIVQNLDKRYPGHVNVEQSWVFNNAGGAMGALYVIHGSITEYLIIFGTAIGTEGHTGRYLADDYFIILDGEQWSFSEGRFDRDVYLPGSMHHLPRGESRQYKIPEHCFALEYARGWIPLMLPFGIADTLTSTLDFHTLGRTFYIYGRAIIGELLQGKI
eukprot:TRINITY_DN797_c0_g2_i1.p1 TRINITY_DN797_c0_g2~~TRINITY_DN797_c0_g2_i1.p1  ORF type:complete len:214 (-),score=26.06 TRINITY_DN797_c0_g2_i1:68-709(-)